MKFFKRIGSAMFLALAFTTGLQAQQTVDKMVATVGDGIRKELITYSDILWQLALEPEVSISPAAKDDLDRALQLLINQRLIVLESKRLPRAAVSEEEIQEEIRRVLAVFPNTSDFIKRLQRVGFQSIMDENFRRMMEERAAIEKYLDFRFRSFVVITPDEEGRFYREVFVPQFRKENPGLLVPSIDQKRADINRLLSERKIATDIERFLDNAKERAEIVVF